MADKLLLDIPGDDLQFVRIKTKLGEVITEYPVGNKIWSGRSQDNFMKNEVFHGENHNGDYQYGYDRAK